MQCGTMSVKNLIERLGVHDKTDHTLGSQVTLTSQGHAVLREYSNHVGSAQA